MDRFYEDVRSIYSDTAPYFRHEKPNLPVEEIQEEDNGLKLRSRLHRSKLYYEFACSCCGTWHRRIYQKNNAVFCLNCLD